MKKSALKLAITLSAVAFASVAQAQTVYTDNFSSSVNYLTNGVAGTMWDGIYLGAGEFPNGANGNAAGSTLIANANLSSNNVFTVQSTQTDWEGFGSPSPDDGFFLFKTVSGDFSAIVHIIGFDNGNFNTAGLQARAFDASGAPAFGNEQYVSWSYFYDQFGIANYFRTCLNGAVTQRPIFEAPANTNRWLRLDRAGDTFVAYERALITDPWVQRDSQSRTDLTARPVQIGLMHATFANAAPRTSMFEQFSLVASNLTAGATPGAPSGLTITTNGSHDLVASWTPGTSSDGSVLVVWSGSSVLKEAPANGTTYTGNSTYGAGNTLPGTNFFVIFSGAGSSATISNLVGSVTYNAAVFSFAGSGPSITYNHTPSAASAVGAAVATSIQFVAPSAPIVAGTARRIPVTVLFDNGSRLDVTASANFTSSVPAVVNVTSQGKGRLVALTNGGPVNISATFQPFQSNITVSVVSLSLTHRYSFNGATVGDTNIVDSAGGANGFVVTDGSSGLDGTGNLLLSGAAGNFGTLPADLLTNYGGITFEVWGSDATGLNGSRFADFGNDATHFTYISALAGGGPRGAINDGTGLQQATGPALAVNSPHHYTFTLAGSTRIGKLYIDGLLTASNSISIMPEDVGRTANDWIGRSQANGLFGGTINEIRTFNGPLSPEQIVLDATSGPDTITGDPGAVTAVAISAGSPLFEGDTEPVSTTITFATAGPVNGTTLATYVSTAPGVARVDQFGTLSAVGGGTATVWAVYKGVSNSVVITVVPKAVTLQFRYSFTNDATESIQGANGIIHGNTTFANGQAVFDGVNANDSYIELPGNLLINFNSVSIETWYTDDNAGTWNRVWDLGNNTTDYLFLTVNPANGLTARTAIRTPTVGEQQVNFRRPSEGVEHHVVYTQDAASQTAKIYVDGLLVATNAGTVTLRPKDLTTTAQNWLAKSQFGTVAGGDAGFKGSINEFRVWESAMTALQVSLSYGLGPDNYTLLTNTGSFVSMSVSVNNTNAGKIQQATATVNFTGISGLNFTPYCSNWASSDATVAKVDQKGIVTAVGIGTANISATYAGNSASGSVTVSAGSAPVLVNRYSFTSDASDSVGGANGTLQPGATISGGAVSLTGAANSYVVLPGHLIDGMNDITIETWATFTNSSPATARLWDFGYSGATNWLDLVPRGANGLDTQVRYGATFTNNAPTGGTLGDIIYVSRGNVQGAGSGTTNVHYTVVISASLGEVDIYLNGELRDSLSWIGRDRGLVVPLLVSRINNVESYLGHAVRTNAAVPPNAICNIDEFRIWNGAMDAAQVKASDLAGPNTASINPGALSSISTTLNDPTMIVGAIQKPRVRGAFAVGTLDLTGVAGVGLTSGNTSILQVDGNRVKAVGVGSANLTTTYGGMSAVTPVTVIAKQLKLLHRYTFNGDAHDLIGHADGTLRGNARIATNNVVLDGSIAPLSYVQLPSDLISGMDAVSVEVFATLGAAQPGNFTRLFDFGDEANGTGSTYFFETPNVDANNSRAVTFGPNSPVRNGGNALGGGGQIEAQANMGTVLGRRVHIAVTADENAKTISYYTNGVQVVNNTNVNVNLSSIVDNRNFIGRSLFTADPALIANIDEVRVYYGTMSAAQVAASFAAGADAETLRATTDGSSVTVTWPNTPVTEGYSLQYTLTLTPVNWLSAGAATVVGGNNQVTIPLTNSMSYFRLIK